MTGNGINGAAKSAIEALKSNPLVLAVILLNLIFIGAGLLYLRAEQRQMDDVLKACLDGSRR